MEFDLKQLSLIQLDGLKEVANIGACHSATALSELTSQKVMVKVPVVSIASMDKIFAPMVEQQQQAVLVLIDISGQITGRTVLMFSRGEAGRFTDCLLRRPIGSNLELSPLEESALKETSNILTCAYMNALTDLLGLITTPTTPTFMMDTAQALLGRVSDHPGLRQDVAFCIETEFSFVDKHASIRSWFLLLPDDASLKAMLQAMHLV